jgi:acid stress chaperone HdeB
MRFKLIVPGLVLAIASVSSAQAQVTLDASKVTCDQFVHSKVGSPRVVGAWLTGFYYGKRDNRILDLQSYEGNLSKLEQFCYVEANFKMPVMQAIEKLFDASK